jgi:curved DNA-binding protein CbpA
VLEAHAREEDAYVILDVPLDADKAAVKKRYWKMSLLVHPDKCAHPKAQDAFDIVLKAHKVRTAAAR